MTSRSRRNVLQAGAAMAGAYALGFPAIARGQADKIKIGHLTPLTGFLGALGDYAVLGLRMAEEEINKAGGVMGASWKSCPRTRSIRHRRHQGAAHARARRRDRADGRDLIGLRAHDRPGGGAQQAPVHEHRRTLRCPARQELQQVHVPRRHPQHRDGLRSARRCCATTW